MNRVLISSAIVLAGVVGVTVNMQRVVSADQAKVVTDGGLCGIFVGPEEDGLGGMGQITTHVENADKVMMVCKGTGLANDTGRAQSADGFLCGLRSQAGTLLLTEDSHVTVSSRGVGTMICTYYK